MAEKELKECPFCGNDDPDLLGRGGYWWILCTGCGMKTHKSNLPTARDDQIRRWNRRPLPTELLKKDQAHD